MFWRLHDGPEFKPRFYLNGFPKAGLHLLAMLVMGICRPYMDTFKDHWAGTFDHNAWTNMEADLRFVLYRIGQVPPGHYIQAHAGYFPDLARMLSWSGVAHVFIVRDLRDVAVSQAHHIISSDGKRFLHPAKEAYTLLGGFDEVLMAVIEGLGPFPGVMDRWGRYAGWLHVEETLVVRYEEARENLEATARAVLEHGLGQIYPLQGEQIKVEASIFDQQVRGMLATGGNPQLSPTYRKARVGDWREVFTEEHKAAFKRTDQDGWLVQMGYENSEKW
jgi:hypothetical protein